MATLEDVDRMTREYVENNPELMELVNKIKSGEISEKEGIEKLAKELEALKKIIGEMPRDDMVFRDEIHKTILEDKK